MVEETRFIMNGKRECVRCADVVGNWIGENMQPVFTIEELGQKLKNINTLGCAVCRDDPCSICLLSKENLSGQ